MNKRDCSILSRKISNFDLHKICDIQPLKINKEGQGLTDTTKTSLDGKTAISLKFLNKEDFNKLSRHKGP